MTSNHVSGLVFRISCLKNLPRSSISLFNKYITFFTCVCTVIDNRWRHRTKQNVRHETSRGVTVVLYTLWRLLWSITCTRTEKCRLFVLYNKNLNGLLKDVWGIKKRKTSTLRDPTWIWRHLCIYIIYYMLYVICYMLYVICYIL